MLMEVCRVATGEAEQLGRGADSRLPGEKLGIKFIKITFSGKVSKAPLGHICSDKGKLYAI